MKLTDQEQVILKAIGSGVAEVSRVIRAVGYPKATVKKVLVRLNEKGIVALHRHDYPQSLTPDQRKMMVMVGANYYGAVSVRKRNPAKKSKGKVALKKTGKALKGFAQGALSSAAQILGAGAEALNPGRVHLPGLPAKAQREYEHVLKSELAMGRSLKRAKSIAAGKVRKDYGPNPKKKVMYARWDVDAITPLYVYIKVDPDMDMGNAKADAYTALESEFNVKFPYSAIRLKGDPTMLSKLPDGIWEVKGAKGWAWIGRRSKQNPKKANKTVIRAGRIDHLDVSKVHNPKGPIPTPQNRDEYKVLYEVYSSLRAVHPKTTAETALFKKVRSAMDRYDKSLKRVSKPAPEIIWQVDNYNKTPKSAAEEFARTHWQEQRKIRGLKPDGTFKVVGGVRTYRVRKDGRLFVVEVVAQNPRKRKAKRNASKTRSAASTAKRRAGASSAGRKTKKTSLRSVAKTRKSATRRASSNPTRKGMRKLYREAKRISKITRGRYFSSESGQRKAARHEKQQARKSRRNALKRAKMPAWIKSAIRRVRSNDPAYSPDRVGQDAFMHTSKAQRDAFDQYLVSIGHPSAYEAGTQEYRIKRFIRERVGKRGRRNPSAQSIRKTFAGSVNGERDLFFPQGTPSGKLAKLGRLVSITTEAGTIKPVHGTAWLCADTKGKLHIGATSNSPLYSGPARNFGHVTKLEYESSKPHLGYRGPIIWFHKAGEENGIRPTLRADGKGGLVFRGGDYRLTERGIEN